LKYIWTCNLLVTRHRTGLPFWAKNILKEQTVAPDYCNSTAEQTFMSLGLCSIIIAVQGYPIIMLYIESWKRFILRMSGLILFL